MNENVKVQDGRRHECPRCLGPVPNEEHKGEYPGATSRADNESEVCSACGQDEAAGRGPIPVRQWPIPELAEENRWGLTVLDMDVNKEEQHVNAKIEVSLKGLNAFKDAYCPDYFDLEETVDALQDWINSTVRAGAIAAGDTPVDALLQDEALIPPEVLRQRIEANPLLPWPRDHRRYGAIQTLGELLHTLEKKGADESRVFIVTYAVDHDNDRSAYDWFREKEDEYFDQFQQNWNGEGHAPTEAEVIGLVVDKELNEVLVDLGAHTKTGTVTSTGAIANIFAELMEHLVEVEPMVRVDGNDAVALGRLLKDYLIQKEVNEEFFTLQEESFKKAEGLWSESLSGDLNEDTHAKSKERRYHQSQESIMDLLDRLKNDWALKFMLGVEHLQMLENKGHALPERGTRAYTEMVQTEGNQFSKYLWENLGTAQQFFVGGHIGSIIEEVAKTIPDDFLFRPHHVFRPTGWVYFDTPLMVPAKSREDDREEIWCRGLSWWIIPPGEQGMPNDGRHRAYFIWWVHRDDHTYNIWTDNEGQPFDWDQMPVWSPFTFATWGFGIPHTKVDTASTALALWLVFNQPLAKPVGAQAPRFTRKRREKHEAPLDGDIHISYLRRQVGKGKTKKKQSEENDNHYHYQHIVRPHWQRYRTRNGVEWKLKNMYVRGPEDAPLIFTDTINAVVR